MLDPSKLSKHDIASSHHRISKMNHINQMNATKKKDERLFPRFKTQKF